MKTARLCLLILLSLLLPVHGAVAAAMLCPAGSGHETTLNAAVVATDSHVAAGADHAQHHHEADTGGGHATAGAEKCNLCCDFCSMTPLLSSPPSIPVPRDLSAPTFPDLLAPAPSFLSDGQERPPRSC